MKKVSSVVIFVILVLLALGNAHALDYTYTIINHPNSEAPFNSSVTGINNDGTIVGSYWDGTNSHGFSLSGGNYIPLPSIVGALSTQAFRINNGGSIVGWYWDGTMVHGFILSGDTYTTLDYPNGALATHVFDINDQGMIVGWYTDATGMNHGFLATPQYTLNVAKAGNGNGDITGTGISCGADCTEIYDYGSVVALTSAPNTGSSFTSWTGCDSTSGNTCTVNMTSNKSISAAFTLNQYTLTVGKSGTGSGTIAGTGISCGIDCTESYLYGTVVALTASANTGSTFSGWTGCDAVSGNVCALTITNNKSVSAAFTLNQHTLTATKTGTGSGTLTASGLSCTGDTCTGIYNYNDTVTVTPTPATGSVFGEWTECDSIADTVCTVLIHSERSVTASFYLEYTLAVTLEGTGDGRVMSTPSGIDCEPTCSETFVVGTPIQLAAKPYGGSVFAYWSGACTGTTDTCDLVMTDYIGVTAHFTSENTKEYTLKVKKAKKNKGDGIVTSTDGNIDCGENCSYKYYKDTVITLSAEANEGSTFLGWKPGTPTCTGTDPCTVTIDKAKTVQAVFVGDYTLKVINKSKEGGKGLVSSIPSGISCSTVSKEGCTATYGYYEAVTLSASADSGSTFLGWKPAKLCPGTGVCMVTMEKRRNIKAVFVGE